jgi:hypothetical protein
MTESADEFHSSRHQREVRIASWQDAEELAAWHMRTQLGFADAQVTRSGPDGGLDAVAASAAAQVKHYAGPVGAPEVQRLVGAAHLATTRIFYAQTGFTDSARAYAESGEVALFSYDVYGDVTPVGEVARRLVELASFTDPEGQAAEDESMIAYMGSIADRLTEALRTVEATRETDMPAVFVCAEIAVQLAVAASVREAANADDLREHDRLDAEIASAIRSDGPVRPPSWWIGCLHEWGIRRGRLLARDGQPASEWAVDGFGVAGVVTRWPFSVGADLSYLGWYVWPQERWITQVVADRLVRLDPLRKSPKWCRGAMWHVNRSLPWALEEPLNVRFYDDLVPDVSSWRVMFNLDDDSTPQRGALWD